MGERKPKSFADKSDDMSSLPETGVVGSVKSAQTSMGQRRYMLLVFAFVLVALVVGGAIIFYIGHRSPKTVSICGSAVTHDASNQNNLKNQTTFGELVSRIKTKPDYTRDPNCMYIVAEYQILMGEYGNAQATIDTLKKDYGEGYAYDKNLDEGQASLHNLQQQFEQAKQADDNSKGGIDPAI